MELRSCPPFYPVEGLFCDGPLSVFLFQESLLLCDMFRRRYKATRGSRFPNWFWLAVHVRDPIQMSVRQLFAADRLFDVRPQPQRRVVFPEWYVWSAFDSGPLANLSLTNASVFWTLLPGCIFLVSIPSIPFVAELNMCILSMRMDFSGSACIPWHGLSPVLL